MNDNLKRISRNLSYIYQFDKDVHKLYGLNNQIDPEGYDFYIRVEDLDRLLKYKNINGGSCFYHYFYNDPIELLTKQQLTYDNDYLKINANNLQIFKSKGKQYFTLNKIDISNVIGGIKGDVRINDKDIELLEKQSEEIAETSIITKLEEIFNSNIHYCISDNGQIDTIYVDYNDSQNWMYKTDYLKNRINLLLELSGYYNKENSNFWQIHKLQDISDKIYNDKCDMYMLFSEYELNNLSKNIYPNSLFKVHDNLCSFVFCDNYDNVLETIENYKFLIQESKIVLRNNCNKLFPETLNKNKIVKIDLSYYDNKMLKPIWYDTSNSNIIFTNNILNSKIIVNYDLKF